VGCTDAVGATVGAGAGAAGATADADAALTIATSSRTFARSLGKATAPITCRGYCLPNASGKLHQCHGKTPATFGSAIVHSLQK
jgi:hypothetical protein